MNESRRNQSERFLFCDESNQFLMPQATGRENFVTFPFDSDHLL